MNSYKIVNTEKEQELYSIIYNINKTAFEAEDISIFLDIFPRQQELYIAMDEVLINYVNHINSFITKFEEYRKENIISLDLHRHYKSLKKYKKDNGI